VVAVTVVVEILGIILKDDIQAAFAQQQCDFIAHGNSPFLNKFSRLLKWIVLENFSDFLGGSCDIDGREFTICSERTV
jgi:hypothetical protein